ncbi:MAG: nitrous oxide reductase family maturation protein NosD [Parvularculaceae bacterium]
MNRVAHGASFGAMTIRLILAIASTVLSGAAQAADLAAKDAPGLTAALDAARAGDRIVLAPGAYGALTIGPRRGRGAVTLTASDPRGPPVFQSILVRDADDLTFENLIVTLGPATAPLSTYAIEIRRSARVRLEGLTVSSAANGVSGDDGYGVFIRDSQSVNVVASRLHDVFRGIAVFDSDDVGISGNTITRAGSDGVVARGAVRLTIENNSVTEFDPVDPVRWHPDAIQLWSRGASRANEAIVIRGNTIARGKGRPAQGIFIKSPEIASRGILIDGNAIDQSMGQGIFVQNGEDVLIRGNSLRTVEPVLHPPAIEVRLPFANARVENNVAPVFRLPEGVLAHGNRKPG